MAKQPKHPDLDPEQTERRDRMIHPKAEAFLEADEAFKIATAARKEAHESLRQAMAKRGKTIYRTATVLVEVAGRETLKAKRLSGIEAAADDEKAEE